MAGKKWFVCCIDDVRSAMEAQSNTMFVAKTVLGGHLISTRENGLCLRDTSNLTQKF